LVEDLGKIEKDNKMNTNNNNTHGFALRFEQLEDRVPLAADLTLALGVFASSAGMHASQNVPAIVSMAAQQSANMNAAFHDNAATHANFNGVATSNAVSNANLSASPNAGADLHASAADQLGAVQGGSLAGNSSLAANPAQAGSAFDMRSFLANYGGNSNALANLAGTSGAATGVAPAVNGSIPSGLNAGSSPDAVGTPVTSNAGDILSAINSGLAADSLNATSRGRSDSSAAAQVPQAFGLSPGAQTVANTIADSNRGSGAGVSADDLQNVVAAQRQQMLDQSVATLFPSAPTM